MCKSDNCAILTSQTNKCKTYSEAQPCPCGQTIQDNNRDLEVVINWKVFLNEYDDSTFILLGYSKKI